MARKAMLIDLTRCIGCDACTVACKQENGTPVDTFFARVLNVESGSYPNVRRLYVPVLCNHCENPACLKACPNKAIFKRQDGVVLIDQDRCRGTGACVSACPYGNIILSREDRWYLDDQQSYERDYVKPRLRQQVARKCTFCVQRTDQGLDPACVVACPTTARIFGDMDDPNSRISTYVVDQQASTGRDPFKLLPEAGTEPANMYLGTMADQQVSTLGGEAPNALGEPPLSPSAAAKPGAAILVFMWLMLTCLFAQPAHAQSVEAALAEQLELYSASSCAGCHGKEAMGGLGPPLAETKVPLQDFMPLVRKGKGMMSATPTAEMSDEEVKSIYSFVKATKLDPAKIPISYKIGALLTTRNLGHYFLLVFLLSVILSVKVLLYWIDCAGWKYLKPAIRKFGSLKAAKVILVSLVIDGLLVASLWRKSRFRWLMHGLVLYGFLGLGLADMLMSIFNPLRTELPLTHPLKLLPNIAGAMVIVGVLYVRRRYVTDQFIDNGVTLGRDYLFLHVLGLTIFTGFVVEYLGYVGAVEWVLPGYLAHLCLITILFVSAPFTRANHAFIVPAMVALTRLTEEITLAGVDLGFEREPSPGRHHKSQRIADQVAGMLSPETSNKVVLRYYP